MLPIIHPQPQKKRVSETPFLPPNAKKRDGAFSGVTWSVTPSLYTAVIDSVGSG